MAFEVLRTPRVRRAVEQMRRTERAGYEAARDELRGRGCLVGGYRLASTDILAGTTILIGSHSFSRACTAVCTSAAST
jgi:hypothetical protein